MKIFLTSSASKVMDKITPLLGKDPSELRLAFIPTAGDPYGDDKPWMDEDREMLRRLGFQVEDFDLKNKTENSTRAALSQFDVIFVAGGNTFYLLKYVQESGFNNIAKELVKDGTIYIGSSAGSIIAGPNIEPLATVDNPHMAKLDSKEGIGLVNFVVLPHCGNKYGTKYEAVIKKYGDKYKLVLLTDDQFVFADGVKYEVI